MSNAGSLHFIERKIHVPSIMDSSLKSRTDLQLYETLHCVLVVNPFFYVTLLKVSTASALKTTSHRRSVNKDGQGLGEWTDPGIFHFPNGKLLAFFCFFFLSSYNAVTEG